jgi:hypothetical protein
MDEAVQTDLKGDDHLEVGWQGPGVTFGVIDGEYLSDQEGKRGGVTQMFTLSPSGFGRQQPFDAPKQFQAHLVGFRGIGNTMSSKYQGRDGGPIEPAVVLRLADGRKRLFARDSFAAADKAYIMDIYVKEMARIMAGLDKTPYQSGGDGHFPNNAKPGEPGTMRVESDHFVFVSGSQGNGKWINEAEPENAQWYREGSLRCAEYFRAMEEYAGLCMPTWESPAPVKYAVTVAGTVRDGHELIPGYAGGGRNQCILKDAGGGPWSEGLFHEWGHGAPGPGGGMGGGEAAADTHGSIADPAMLKGNHHITRPWRNLWNGINGYGFTDFYLLVGDDPNWGYAWSVCLPGAESEFSMLHTLARTGQQRGIYPQGVRGVGDLVGDYGARLTTFDCEMEDLFRRERFAPARNWLEPVDRAGRIYRIPYEEAAEPFGINMCRLVADPGADRVVVDFLGRHDPESYSDWRACIIAVAADGTRRYSPLWNKGEMTLKIEPGDRCHWLSVAATPTALFTSGKWTPAQLSGKQGQLYSGRHAFRYPWQVRLQGAQPGTPRNRRADLDDADGIYTMSDGVPAPHDTPAGKRFLTRLKSFEQNLTTIAANAGDTKLILDSVSYAKARLNAELARMTDGARHPNGGGWVQSTAHVAPTAWVGPDAMVLDQAQVLDHAIIEDYAIVADRAVVADHARVSGQGIVKKQAEVRGYARTWTVAEKTGEAPVVPVRPGATKLHKFGLWANYAMDRADHTTLEDWYRYTFDADKSYGMNLVPVLNGYLHGGPAFVVDGDRRGFSFDGKTQWAELCPRVADLGEMTIDLALKCASNDGQVIFDLGSSAENCLVLKTDASGTPQLIATVAGKRVVELAGKKALTTNQWARLRVESDGRRTSLWLDGEMVAETASDFRPCQVFPAGLVKRNFLGVSRAMTAHFKGVIDDLVVYHAVHGDFSKLPPPVRDCSVRPTDEFVAAVKKQQGSVKAVEKEIAVKLAEQIKPYNALETQWNARRDELFKRDAGYEKANAALAAAEMASKTREQELVKQFDQNPDVVAKKAGIARLRRVANDLKDKVKALENAAFAADSVLAGLEVRRKEFQEKVRIIAKELAAAFEQQPEVVLRRTEISEWRKQADKLQAEAGKTPETKRRHDELMARIRDADEALRVQFDDLCDKNRENTAAIRSMNETAAAILPRQQVVRRRLSRESPVVREAEKAEQDCRPLEEAMEADKQRFMTAQMADSKKRINDAKGEFKQATAKAERTYLMEMEWGRHFHELGFHGYYNTHYEAYLMQYVKDRMGGGEMREDVAFLDSLLKDLTREDAWRTSVDWVKPGDAEDPDEPPLIRKWKTRMGIKQ